MKRLVSLLVAILVLAAPLFGLPNATALGPNLIKNPSVETVNPTNTALPQSWKKNKWGTNTTKFTYVKDAGHTGTKSVKTQVTAYASGDAKWYFNPVTIQPNKTYTFTDYYKSDVPTEVVVQVKNAAGTLSYYSLGEPTASSTTWKAFTANFTSPADAKSATVLHIVNRVGWLQLDDAYLGLGDNPATPPSINITAPATGSTISGTVVLTANATDDKGVAGVQFKVDGANIGAEDIATPYSINWDSLTAANGSHTITAAARNINGLSTTSNPVQVTVNNQAPDPLPDDGLIENGSVETPDPANAQKPVGWSSNAWGTNTTVFTYEQTGHTGNRSVKTNVTAYTDGDAKWYANPKDVKSAQKYTYKHYYKSNVETQAIAAYIDANGVWSYTWLQAVPASTDWRELSLTFTTPASAKQATILHVVDRVGWLQLDTANLAENASVPVTSPVPNPSLETSTNNTPDNWQQDRWGNNNAAFEYMNEGHTGTKSAKVTVSNYVDGDAKWHFNPITNLENGRTYTFSAWYKTNTTPHIAIAYTDASGTPFYRGLRDPFPASNSTTVWQSYNESFTVPDEAKSMTIYFFVAGNGWLQIDDYDIKPYQPVGFNRPLVSLTFDDSFIDNVDTALPVMQSYGFKSTQCYGSAFVEAVPEGEPAVRTFFNAGHEICSHTVTHPFLTQLSPTDVHYELSHSQQVLESIIGQPVRSFASPYGDYNYSVNEIIKQYYRSHRTVDEGYNSKDNFDIQRVMVQNLLVDTTLAEYQSWLDHAKATNTWLVLVYHRVTSASDIEPFDTPEAQFQAQMAALNASGIMVKTYSAALDELLTQL